VKLAWASLVSLASLGACADASTTSSDAALSSAPSAAASVAEGAPASPPPDGGALVAELECNRCHTETGVADAPRDKHCVRCHADIASGRFEAAPGLLAEWRPRVVALRHAPSLGGVGTIVDPTWAARYLRGPFDLRPHLVPEMPRLALDRASARAIAEHLAAKNRAAHAAPAPSPPGDPSRGRALFEAKGCASCHAFTGAGLAVAPVPREDDGAERTLAPDLRFARERLLRDAVAAWIVDPASLKTGAAMPKQKVTDEEARDLAAFVLDAPLERAPATPPLERLAVLERPVGYDEVASRVLHKMCWHCHSQPDFARGDGGPGNTGGFGFAARKLDLSTYEAVLSGFVDERGERVSVFSSGPSGEPRLVEALVARWSEERGENGPTRGMPLGLPPLSREDVQLVESWVAQGHPR
jgi:mono/diheme cytochrome c family protein